jgi:hypothetical protein
MIFFYVLAIVMAILAMFVNSFSGLVAAMIIAGIAVLVDRTGG